MAKLKTQFNDLVSYEAPTPAEWTEITIVAGEAVFPSTITNETQFKMVIENSDGGGIQEIYFYGSLALAESEVGEGARLVVYDHFAGAVIASTFNYNNSTNVFNLGNFVSPTLANSTTKLFYR
jgi:hypothetical protein